MTKGLHVLTSKHRLLSSFKPDIMIKYILKYIIQFRLGNKLPSCSRNYYKYLCYLGIFYSFHDKAILFCNVFEARTLLPSNYFWFYKFTSENIRRILITPKTKFDSFSRWPNYGRFCPEVYFD